MIWSLLTDTSNLIENSIMEKSKQMYWSMVWDATVKTFFRHFEGRKKVVELLVVAVFTAFCSLLAIFWLRGKVTIGDIGLIIPSVIGGPFLWILFIFVVKCIQAPYYVFREITKISPSDIEVNPYYPPSHSVHRTGLLIRNNKDFSIENCQCSLVYLQIDKTVPDFLKFPYYLAWIKDNTLVWEAIDIKPGDNASVAIQTWDRPSGAEVLHANPIDKDIEFGPATGIEIGGRGGLAIYRDRYYKAGFRLDFSISGKDLFTPTFFFELKFDGENIKFIKVKSQPV
jgi:hypothetical protein